MATKVWTREQREAASRLVFARKNGNTEADDFEHTHWAKQRGTDVALLIDLQCDLAEAVELLNAYIHNVGVDGPRVVSFLQRNTPQEKP